MPSTSYVLLHLELIATTLLGDENVSDDRNPSFIINLQGRKLHVNGIHDLLDYL
jgi:hypothetical protein